MNTDAINHDPAITFIQTGSQQPGRPSMGSWVSYGLGSENQNLPAFVVLISQAQRAESGPAALLAPVGQRLSAVAIIRACAFAAGGDPVLYLHNPRGNRPGTRREMLDAARRAESHAPR